jgi:hypothetical protein
MVTVPNFSYFLDAPAPHTLYNRARILRVTERFVEAGLNVALQLQAYEPQHWRYWSEVLQQQALLKYVCLEFQTGLRSFERGLQAYQALVRLKSAAGSGLHPILVAGQRFLRWLPSHFDGYTIVDSVPFMRTIKRRSPYSRPGGLSWRRNRTHPDECLNGHLIHAIGVYREAIEKKRQRHAVQTEMKLPGEFPRKRILPRQRSVTSLELFSAQRPVDDSRISPTSRTLREPASRQHHRIERSSVGTRCAPKSASAATLAS